MIRIVGNRLIVPRGDTGIFTIPVIGFPSEGDVAVFSVRDNLTQETLIEKIIDAYSSHLVIHFEHEDTANIPAGKYTWGLKIYRNPQYDEDGVLIDAVEVDSYYSAYSQPQFIVKEVAKR